MTNVLAIQQVTASTREKSLILWFDQVGIKDIPLVGGKNASLGEMMQQLTPKGINIPNGFATTAYTYRYFIETAGLEAQLRQLFTDLDVEDVKNLQQRGKKARALIMNTPFPVELERAIAISYETLCYLYGEDIDVAVRSSATAEDLPDASLPDNKKPTLIFTGLKVYSKQSINVLLQYSQTVLSPTVLPETTITLMWLFLLGFKKWSVLTRLHLG